MYRDASDRQAPIACMLTTWKRTGTYITNNDPLAAHRFTKPGTRVKTSAQSPFEIGVVGLGVMGSNLALNLVEHGFPVIGLDRNVPKADAFRETARRLRADVAADGTTETAVFI